MWRYENIEIREGFLDGLNLPINPRLTCVIGARGSGKSTLAMALRYAVLGMENASKQRSDLLRANLGRSVVNVRIRRADEMGYAIRRESKGSVVLTTEDGRVLPNVDLERGTFLPLDAYSSGEIEEIANEDLGPRRRVLLDQLHAAEIQAIWDEVAVARRALEANADDIRAAEREMARTSEQILALSDAPARLAAISTSLQSAPGAEALQVAARQHQTNLSEKEAIEASSQTLSRLRTRANDLLSDFSKELQPKFQASMSSNKSQMLKVDGLQAALIKALDEHVSLIRREVDTIDRGLTEVADALSEAHLNQAASYLRLREANEAVGQAAKERAEAEQAVQRLRSLEVSLAEKNAKLESIRNARMELRSKYLQLGDRVSDLRIETAASLQSDTGASVRIGVRRAADRSEYLQRLSEALRGAGVSKHESIVDAVARLRPDELSSIIAGRDYAEFESITNIEGERGRKVLDAFRFALDPLALELLRPDDMVSIELNVGGDREVFRDASKLSQGQKCTALLPLLLARRQAPLIIDQPEDNLDNHFIYETVVKSILRMKERRQMVFVTHNANIPVLAEAELVVVLSSDGEKGRIEKMGSLDECRQEIVDLLEGGKEAFELRRERYGH